MSGPNDLIMPKNTWNIYVMAPIRPIMNFCDRCRNAYPFGSYCPCPIPMELPERKLPPPSPSSVDKPPIFGHCNQSSQRVPAKPVADRDEAARAQKTTPNQERPMAHCSHFNLGHTFDACFCRPNCSCKFRVIGKPLVSATIIDGPCKSKRQENIEEKAALLTNLVWVGKVSDQLCPCFNPENLAYAAINPGAIYNCTCSGACECKHLEYDWNPSASFRHVWNGPCATTKLRAIYNHDLWLKRQNQLMAPRESKPQDKQAPAKPVADRDEGTARASQINKPWTVEALPTVESPGFLRAAWEKLGRQPVFFRQSDKVKLIGTESIFFRAADDYFNGYGKDGRKRDLGAPFSMGAPTESGALWGSDRVTPRHDSPTRFLEIRGRKDAIIPLVGFMGRRSEGPPVSIYTQPSPKSKDWSRHHVLAFCLEKAHVAAVDAIYDPRKTVWLGSEARVAVRVFHDERLVAVVARAGRTFFAASA